MVQTPGQKPFNAIVYRRVVSNVFRRMGWQNGTHRYVVSPRQANVDFDVAAREAEPVTHFSLQHSIYRDDREREREREKEESRTCSRTSACPILFAGQPERLSPPEMRGATERSEERERTKVEVVDELLGRSDDEIAARSRDRVRVIPLRAHVPLP